MTDLETVDALAGAADLGELIRKDDRVGLRFVRRYHHPIERVWRALTESDQLRFWMPCDIVGERRAGARITLPFWPGHVAKYSITEPVLDGEIQVWEPPTRFGWTWGGDVLLWEPPRSPTAPNSPSPPGRPIRTRRASSVPRPATTSV